eukprot:TRINITY_DN7414_c0_g1_i3.p1 TRINITY_DN7414_c0_g1~~TRINITY_DN7414_c0_g1_i3.p1  ORF type:complete len:112 (-),score=10.25 TRINITY_DN7414_c0_g1_i3:284-619(-)
MQQLASPSGGGGTVGPCFVIASDSWQSLQQLVHGSGAMSASRVSVPRPPHCWTPADRSSLCVQYALADMRLLAVYGQPHLFLASYWSAFGEIIQAAAQLSDQQVLFAGKDF